MRILVTGAKGMVGSYVAGAFSAEECLLTNIDTLDICDKDSVGSAFKKFNPGVVLHLAAATDVDRCETEPVWAEKINVLGTRNIADACRESNSRLVFISSGAVFDGEKETPYKETDAPRPISVYGRTKLEAEGIIANTLKDYLIIRAGWMIGGGIKDVKFVGKIARKMQESDTVKVVNDKFGSITYARELLVTIKKLLVNKCPSGVYHAASRGMVSRYDIATEIKRILSLENVKIIAVSSAEFILPAPRGRSEALENARLKDLNLDGMHNWKESLEDYLLNDFSLAVKK